MLNKTISLQIFLKYKMPFIKAIQHMDDMKNNNINKFLFNQYVKEQIEIEKGINGKENKRNIENIKEAYSIRNMTNNGFISIDEGEERLYFIKYLEEMFRDIDEDIKPKPITNRTFIDHLNNVKYLIKDSKEYEYYNDNEKELFIEDLKIKFNSIKQDFEQNKNNIQKEADNLSHFINDESNDTQSKRVMMQEIIKLSDKYIEPFLEFIKSVNNRNGFMSKLKKIQRFFEDIEKDSEAYEIQRFIINFKGYNKDISNIYEKINDYRRKGSEDLTVYNAFEKVFNNLNSISNEILDGLLKNNTLESSDFHKNFSFLDGIKQNNTKKNEIAINYEETRKRFLNIEESFLLYKDKNIEETKLEINEERLSKIKSKSLLQEKQVKINIEKTRKISKVLAANIKELLKEDQENDIIYKIHQILKKNINDYKAFYIIYAYNSIRKRIPNVRVGYNERKTIEINNQKYKYRPIYNLGDKIDE